MNSKFDNKTLRVNIFRNQTNISIIKILSRFPKPMSLFSTRKIYRKPLAGTSNEEISTELHLLSAYYGVAAQKL